MAVAYFVCLFILFFFLSLNRLPFRIHFNSYRSKYFFKACHLFTSERFHLQIWHFPFRTLRLPYSLSSVIIPVFGILPLVLFFFSYGICLTFHRWSVQSHAKFTLSCQLFMLIFLLFLVQQNSLRILHGRMNQIYKSNLQRTRARLNAKHFTIIFNTIKINGINECFI